MTVPPFPVLLANRERLTQRTVHEAIHDWLSDHGGVRNVRFTPSKIRREQVHADVDPTVVLETNPDAEVTKGRLEVEFEFPQDVDQDHYRIQWIEPQRNYSVGWHQDDHRNDLGACHLQLDYGDEVADVRSAGFLDVHPLNVLEAQLEQLPDVLGKVSWTEEDEPRFDR